MDEKVLNKLEYQRVIDRLVEGCGTACGKELAAGLAPMTSIYQINQALEETSQAKELIHEGLVQVGGQVCLLRGKKLRPGDRVRVALDPPLLLEVEAEAHAG